MRTPANMIEMKEYDTFNIVFEYRDDDNTLLPLGDIAVVADLLSTSNQPSEQLNVQIVPDRSLIILTRNITDDYLPYGNYRVDLIVTDNVTHRRVTTPDVNVAVRRGVTTPRGL